VTGFVADASVAIAWATDSQADDGAAEFLLRRRVRLTRPQWSSNRTVFADLPVVTDAEASGLAPRDGALNKAAKKCKVATLLGVA
jgi:hypothetical protein